MGGSWRVRRCYRRKEPGAGPSTRTRSRRALIVHAMVDRCPGSRMRLTAGNREARSGLAPTALITCPMDFTIDPADEAFRQEVRAFIAQNLPEDLARRGRQGYHSHPPDVRRWTRILNT